MRKISNDDELCLHVTTALGEVFPKLSIVGGADEPYYYSPTDSSNAVIAYRSNYPRSLLHEMAHYCLAGNRRRLVDDFGYWYSPCGRSREEQKQFELVEARPQGLEKAMCAIVGIKFSVSIDDFSGYPPSEHFVAQIDLYCDEMLTDPPPTAKKVLYKLKEVFSDNYS